MTTHESVKDAIKNMEQMLKVIDSVLKISVAKPETKQELGPYRLAWQNSLDQLKAKELEIRPTASMLLWEKGQKEASKNYNPPSTKGGKG
jgi:hypothetical protein